MNQEKSYVTVNSKETLKQLVDHIQNSEYVAYDTETDSLNPRKGRIIGFSVSGEVGKGFYMPTMVWTGEKLEEVTIAGKSAHALATYTIQKLLDKKLIMHNASFDVRYTKNFYGIDLLPSLYADTGLLVHTVREEGAFGYGNPFGLKPIAMMVQKEIGLDVETEANEEQLALKASIKANGGSTSKDNYEIYKADLEILSKYAAADTDLTLRIYYHFLGLLKEEELEKFFFEDEVMPLYKEVTVLMEQHGVRLDIPLIEQTKVKIVEDLQKHADLVVEELLKDPKIRIWIMERAVEAYPPKNKGTFAQRLIEKAKEKNNQQPRITQFFPAQINFTTIKDLEPDPSVDQFEDYRGESD